MMPIVLQWLRKKHENKKWFKYIEQMIYRYGDDGVSEIGAQLTYYLTLSIFPFLIFFLNILKLTPLADMDVLYKLLSPLPDQSREIIVNITIGILQQGSMALISFGAIGSIWSSSNGIMSLIKAVNRAYDLDEDRPYIKLRILSILLTLGLVLALVISFGILILGELIFHWMIGSDHWLSLLVWKIFKFLTPFFAMVVLFSLLYKFSPSIKKGIRIKWRDTWLGSIFAALGIISASFIFSFYVNNFSNYSRIYGSIGGIIVFLIWLYIASIIVVLGAELNATRLALKPGNKMARIIVKGNEKNK
ncbi:YihY/virulence factor BrkB family protein [Irregularibacter muris]|uniref:YihY/virulence factor BrkB family protein n=2 Tax=Irregularibacter muris TaxID=1796619 RepID=A0AAE3HE28_9FIRM|nr:YihY/virulence factor BrkB family protein [Irregularibacter muris]